MPNGLAVDRYLHRLYVASRENGKLFAVDTYTYRTVGETAVCPAPFGVGVDEILHRVFVACFTTNRVAIVDGESMRLLSYVDVGPEPSWIAVDSARHRVYVTQHGDNTLGVIDGVSKRWLYALRSDDSDSGAWGIAFDPNLNWVYVGYRDSGTVTPFNMETFRVMPLLKVFPFPDDEYRAVYQLAFNPRTNRLYVVGGNNVGKVAVFETKPEGPGLITRVNVGTGGYDGGGGLVVNQRTNNVFVANSKDNTVSVIDGYTYRVKATINVAEDPFGMAVDSMTNTVFVGHRRANIVWMLGDVYRRHRFAPAARGKVHVK